MVDLWISAGLLLVGGAVAAGIYAATRRPEVPVALVEVDEVAELKARVQEHLALEEDLIAAGQALGRVRRFLVDPDEAGPVVDDLRERLADLWLRRFDYEGRLRLSVLRRRVPAPPPIESFDDDLDLEAAEERAVELRELAEAFRDLARRADDSARRFRRLSPAEDAHARWVGDAVEVAQEWRLAQTEEILRFAVRIGAEADRLEELAAQLGEASATALVEAGGGTPREEVRVSVPGLRERVLAVSRVGLAESKQRELDPTPEAAEASQRAVAVARAAVADVRALARKAGGTRSTRTPPLPETDTPEAATGST